MEHEGLTTAVGTTTAEAAHRLWPEADEELFGPPDASISLSP